MIRTTAKYVSLAFLQITLLASSALAESRFCFDAAMLGGSAEVCADVYENPAAPAGETVLAVHGFTEAALSWTPFVEALFEHSAWKYRVKRFIAIDLPGRGNSPMPAGLPGGVFGELYEEDFIDIIVQGIRALRDDGIGPDILMGHSMGGLAVQGVQEELLSEGSSLASLGVSQAVLLGALPALGATWNQVRFPDFVLDLFTQGAPDGPYGQYIFFPPPVARTGPGFTTLSGALATGTPPVEEIAVGAEPYFCTLTSRPAPTRAKGRSPPSTARD